MQLNLPISEKEFDGSSLMTSLKSSLRRKIHSLQQSQRVQLSPTKSQAFSKKDHQNKVISEVSYKRQIRKFGQAPFQTLLKSYTTLEDLVKCYPGMIKLNIPETIICGYDNQLTYMWTNNKGILESKQVKAEFIDELAELFFNKNIVKSKATNCIYPIAVTKFFNEFENDIFLDFFVSSVIERFHRFYQKTMFIIQRFIPNKGFNPSIIRLEYRNSSTFKMFQITSKQQYDGKYLTNRLIQN